jgi:ABC-type sugar transport system ATPase subunit
VLNHGRLIQFDAPRQIYRNPATRFVAEFIGRPAMNTIEGEVRDGVFQAGAIRVAAAGQPDGPVVLGIRPEQLKLGEPGETEGVRLTADVVEHVEPDTLIFLKSGDISLVLRALYDVEGVDAGDEVCVRFAPEALHFFDLESGDRRP